MARMTEDKMVDLLRELLEEHEQNSDAAATQFTVQTFEEAGLLTRNKGLVVRYRGGSEFQIEVQQA